MSYKITETQERFYVEVLVGVKATDSWTREHTHTGNYIGTWRSLTDNPDLAAEVKTCKTTKTAPLSKGFICNLKNFTPFLFTPILLIYELVKIKTRQRMRKHTTQILSEDRLTFSVEPSIFSVGP